VYGLSRQSAAEAYYPYFSMAVYSHALRERLHVFSPQVATFGRAKASEYHCFGIAKAGKFVGIINNECCFARCMHPGLRCKLMPTFIANNVNSRWL
jgi:hypothetical protein